MLLREGMWLLTLPLHSVSLFVSSTDTSIIIRSQTTKGIWMARCVGMEPCTIVMDLEGTDGRERGEV